MSKPIYRHLADQKWRQYKRPIIMQRITQMHVIPDVLPAIDPTASVELRFRGLNVQPGQFVDSRRSQHAPTLTVQVFDKGPRLVTVVAVDSDIPDETTDAFHVRCHGIYPNVEISPTSGTINLEQLKESLLLPWLPPHGQQGAPYHRLSIFVLQQQAGKVLDVAALCETTLRDGFSLRRFITKNSLTPVGVTMFRTEWDEGTRAVMEQHGLPGADLVWRRKLPEKLPYKKKDSKRYR
jgi:large subunit ribosomal protein L35